jgi:hypothetical protein
MEKKKKIWAEPKLTALVRRKPEEGILITCKSESAGGMYGAKCVAGQNTCDLVSAT